MGGCCGQTRSAALVATHGGVAGEYRRVAAADVGGSGPGGAREFSDPGHGSSDLPPARPVTRLPTRHADCEVPESAPFGRRHRETAPMAETAKKRKGGQPKQQQA